MKLILKTIAVFLSSTLTASAYSKPNVVVVMIDDQGYGDISAHGNTVIQTPNMDKLHSESVRLTDFHVDPTCSPTRAALMTGKYSHRAGVWHTIAGGNHLRASEMTMADAFGANGYRTALFGKWHLGSNFPYRPIDRGFHEWLGQGDGGTGTTDDYFWNDRVNDHYLHNGEWEQIDGWAPDVHFDAAIHFIREQKKNEKRFFLYLPTYIPHTPITLPDQNPVRDYGKNIPRDTSWFFASIERLDRNLGRLRETLAQENLAENTIVIFLTDNGGTGGVDVFNAGMRDHKGSPYDGGHRVPFFIHWPAGGLKQGADVSTLNAHFDVLPTLIDLCGLTLPRQVDFDGRSFAKQLTEPTLELPERTLMVEVQRTIKPEKWNGATAMTERWRLVNNKELYDIQNDPGEKVNVIADHPEVAEKLRADFERYWQRVTPGDREREPVIVGDKRDPVTFLHAADWDLHNTPWNHSHVAAGPNIIGNWRICAATKGTYRFEVRRWPREADAPIAGEPKITKIVDAWTSKGGVPSLLYGGKFTSLPVARVRLRVGDAVQEQAVENNAKSAVFEFPLGEEPTEVSGEFLNAAGKAIAGTYYIYSSKVE